jgi:hypothetical protein
VPCTQKGVAPPHATLQPPQFVVVLSGVSQPSQGSPSQFPKFWLHTGTQAVPTQSVVPFEFVHVLPQAPQWLSLFVKFVSQPLPGVPSQLPKPAVHMPSVQTPFGHVSAAFAKAQGVPQAPQSVSVVVLVSQPLSGLPSQLRKLVLHTGMQSSVPITVPQLVVPFVFVQALAHAAQFVVVPSVVSQPLFVFPSQESKPALHPVIAQVPVVHDTLAFAREQDCPHPPQFVRVVRLVSQPSSGFMLQVPQPVSHVGEQSYVPGMPVQPFVPCAFVHAFAQAAQFDGVPSCVSQPLPVCPSQLSKPALHVPNVQVPVLHDAVALRRLQGTSQSPQLVNVRMSRSQPLSAMLSQLFQPAAQTGVQPFVMLHVVVPCGFVHVSLHERQFAVVPSGVSHAGAPATHSAKPMAHVVAVHVPPPQVSFEFGSSQMRPHWPQSVRLQIDVSQPFAAFASQLSQPVLHMYWQPLAPMQLVEPCGFAHELPHERQLESVPSGVSQPVAAFMSQLPKPVEHVPSVHVPDEHDSAAFARLQSTSQSPQSVSVRMLRSQPLPRLPSQLFQPVSHTGWQPVVGLHDVVACVFKHASPHPRQSVSVPSCVSQPACVEQSRQPLSHAVSVHVPVPHDSLACGRLHITPQPPQSLSVFSGRSQPLVGELSQSSQPASQVVISHEPVAQLGTPCGVEQLRPQAPQLTSVSSSVSQPLLRLPSQSPQPI